MGFASHHAVFGVAPFLSFGFGEQRTFFVKLGWPPVFGVNICTHRILPFSFSFCLKALGGSNISFSDVCLGGCRFLKDVVM